jgi:hypothetical protein
MKRGYLIFTDVAYVGSILLLGFATDGFHKLNLMLIFLILFAFVMLLKRHADYYKLNKKIY